MNPYPACIVLLNPLFYPCVSQRTGSVDNRRALVLTLCSTWPEVHYAILPTETARNEHVVPGGQRGDLYVAAQGVVQLNHRIGKTHHHRGEATRVHRLTSALHISSLDTSQAVYLVV
jgi:hypothetical protein